MKCLFSVSVLLVHISVFMKKRSTHRVARPLLVALVVLLVASSAIAQQKSDVVYMQLMRVKPGMEDQFEATLKRHWGWHKKQGETWSYFVWTVDSGRDEGAYRIASFGHTWEEVDTSNALVAGTPPPEENPDMFRLNEEESYYLYREDLSTAPPLIQPLSVASVTQVLVRPEAVKDFETALRKINNALSRNSQKPGTQGRWYELTTGGDWPEFLLIEDRANWASFHDKGQLNAILNDAYSKQVGEDVVNTFWKSVRSIYTQTLRYHPDISRV